jgi:hypothetical protein
MTTEQARNGLTLAGLRRVAGTGHAVEPVAFEPAAALSLAARMGVPGRGLRVCQRPRVWLPEATPVNPLGREIGMTSDFPTGHWSGRKYHRGGMWRYIDHEGMSALARLA